MARPGNRLTRVLVQLACYGMDVLSSRSICWWQSNYRLSDISTSKSAGIIETHGATEAWPSAVALIAPEHDTDVLTVDCIERFGVWGSLLIASALRRTLLAHVVVPMHPARCLGVHLGPDVRVAVTAPGNVEPG